MATRKKGSAKVTKARKQASLQQRFAIISMPEDKDEAPHWLFWLLVIVFIVLVISIVWQGISISSSLQAYLPYL